LAEFCRAAGGTLLAVGLDYCELRVYSLVLQLSKGTALRLTIGAAMTIRRPSIMILSTVALLVLLGMLFASQVSATSGLMSVTTDTTLTEDHGGSINIDADNVTLDCAGYTVTGSGSDVGILVQDRSNVTVKNCNVTGFGAGIHVGNSSTVNVTSNTADSNGEGFRITGASTNVTVDGNSATDNTNWGFILPSVSGVKMTNNVATNNTLIGFALNVASNNELVGNHSSGSQVQYDLGPPPGSHGNVFTNNTAMGGFQGFTISGSNANTFTGNTASGATSGSGIGVTANSEDNTFTNNTTTGNIVGIDVSDSTGNIFIGNAAHRNEQFGFLDSTVNSGTAGTGNSYTKNVCTGNLLAGGSPSGLCQEEWVALVDTSQGMWHLRHNQSDIDSFFYGNPGDVPFMGDWDCDGIATPGLFRQSDAFAYLRNTNSQGIADIRFFFGNPSDIPLAGDFNGDGCDTLSIYRPSEARFYIVNALGTNDGGLGPADYSFLFGNLGDKPVVGDWDGDGIDEIGLHRESTGLFYWRNTLDTGNADGTIFFGDPGDRFVAGDWGIVDGKDTPGLFRPSDTTFYFRHTLTAGNADSQLEFGQPAWIPVAGDFGFG
jgi:parallel beta-helix repeat protein